MVKRRLQLLLEGFPPTAHPIIVEEMDTVQRTLAVNRTPKALVEIAAGAAKLSDDLSAEYRARDNPQLACKKGCAACCYQRVDIAAPEAIWIIDFLRRSLAEEQFSALAEKIRKADALSRGLTADERVHPDLPCPLLEDGSCSVYEVRPLACRGTTSFSADTCHRVLHDPNERGRQGTTPIPVYGPQHSISRAVRMGLLAGSVEAGLASYPLELNAALLAILDRPEIASRWLTGAPAFAQSRTIDQ